MPRWKSVAACTRALALTARAAGDAAEKARAPKARDLRPLPPVSNAERIRQLVEERPRLRREKDEAIERVLTPEQRSRLRALEKPAR